MGPIRTVRFLGGIECSQDEGASPLSAEPSLQVASVSGEGVGVAGFALRARAERDSGG